MRLADDPRWQRLNNPHFQCPCCGERHAGLFDIAFDHPDPFAMPEGGVQPNSALPATTGDILTEDFARFGEHRFVRAVLPMTLAGTGPGPDLVQFSFGVWATLAPENFDAMVEAFDSRDQSHLGPYFSWLMNKLPGASNTPPKCTMYPQKDGQRPVLLLEDDTHPFYAAQDSAITLDEVLDLYALIGHDIRPHLLDG
ncbi:MAG: DUF2199 domain-containing protein [Alphaproteobacteria bacterium]|nr:DUF2199 domain-containing protein [Alphaproteobacteria bacterium]